MKFSGKMIFVLGFAALMTSAVKAQELSESMNIEQQLAQIAQSNSSAVRKLYDYAWLAYQNPYAFANSDMGRVLIGLGLISAGTAGADAVGAGPYARAAALGTGFGIMSAKRLSGAFNPYLESIKKRFGYGSPAN